MKHYRITSTGKLVQVTTRWDSHVTAANLTEAKAKVMAYARRSLDEAPQLRTKDGATQLAYWTMDGVHVQSGYGTRTDLCLAGKSSMGEVTDSTASFDYYATLSREEVAA